MREVAMDVVLAGIGVVLAFNVAADLRLKISISDILLRYALPVGVLAGALLAWRGIYRTRARYIGLYDFVNMAGVGALSGIALGLLMRLVMIDDQPSFWSTPVLAAFFITGLVSVVRMYRRRHNWVTRTRMRRGQPRKTLIVGAGDAGELIVREIGRSEHSDHLAVGFVDDDPEKVGLMIHGVAVLGTLGDIPSLVDEHSIDEILIAVPSADGKTMRRIVDLCDQTGAKVRTLPPVAAILNNEHHLRYQLREVDIEDLLRREPAQTDIKLSASYISGESVFVTGGGGSIGSELARQIARLAPARLTLMGKGENSIYEIEQELIQNGAVAPTCVIGDVRDRQTLDHAFDGVLPSVVFHAAAHKHVPLMQANVIEAVRNNVLGTMLTAETAVRMGVRKFVYISTDKAVNPSSVMGATKRVGEMIVRALADRSETEFAIVRFGNVLGSRGSLIPMLKKQIQRGGPVRITHPDMTRYFMTIPEAVQLILQAGYMGSKGELFILDMGDPVKIVDLARDLIRLHGLVPGDDIEILYTGIRPGEKTHEELIYAQEELCDTLHPKINRVNSNVPIDYEWLKPELNKLADLCDGGDVDKLRHALMELAWGKNTAPYKYAVTELEPEVEVPNDLGSSTLSSDHGRDA